MDVKVKEVQPCKFFFKFKDDLKKTEIHCDASQTVLEAIKSKPEIRKKLNFDPNRIILEWGRERDCSVIATHFPCSGLGKEDDLITLTVAEDVVEGFDGERHNMDDQNKGFYFVFISTEGGKGAKSKTLFESKVIKNKYDWVCVYGTDNMSLKEAIDKDGRFLKLDITELEAMEDNQTTVQYCDEINKHHERKLAICLKRRSNLQEDKGVENDSHEGVSTRSGASLGRSEAASSSTGVTANRKWGSVHDVLKEEQKAENEANVQEIYDLLRAQYPELKEQLKNRITDKDLKKMYSEVKFENALKAFNQVGLVKDMLSLSESICKIIVGNKTGSGFVLFGHYILTNFHLVKDDLLDNTVRTDVTTKAIFHYDYLDHTGSTTADIKKKLIDYEDGETDYAILEILKMERPVPPGLMKHFCRIPESGEACVVGHPDNNVKMFDPSCIIEKKERINNVNRHLDQFRDDKLALASVKDHLLKQGIERIWCPSDPVYDRATYKTNCMYHGSSGSPVFDTHCKVFGLHTGGFNYDSPKKGNVLEFACPILVIFKKFVSKLVSTENSDLLREVEKEAKENHYLREILNMEKPEPMEVDNP